MKLWTEQKLARRRREKMTVVEWQPDTEKMWHGMVCKIAPKLHTRPRPCPDGLKWGRCNCDLYSNFPQRTSPWHLKFILGSMFKTTVSAVAICLSSSRARININAPKLVAEITT